MELYTQFEISNWEFKTGDGDTYLVDYIYKESITYDACGMADIILSMQMVSDELKKFIISSKGKDIALYRHRIVNTINGDTIPLEEYFTNVKLKSFVEDIANDQAGEFVIAANSSK